MKNWKRIIIATVSTILVGAAFIYFNFRYIAVDDYAELKASGLNGEVRILRDEFGVPHIYGNDSKDILFAVGYTQMQDRMFQFEVYRRLGGGELSEIFGPDMLEADEFARRAGYDNQMMQQTLNRMTADHREHMQAMLAGINFYVSKARENPGRYLPLEFKALGVELRDYTESDLINALSVTGRLYGTDGGFELKNLKFLNDMIAKHGEGNGRIIFDDVLVLTDPDAYTFAQEGNDVLIQKTPVYSDVSYQLKGNISRMADLMDRQQSSYKKAVHDLGLSESASRSLVVGGERSASGNVLMMQATAEGHEVHISGGGMEVAGLSMVPIGLPSMGRTKDFGWLVTTGERDTIDTFAERLNPDNRLQYWYNGAWRDMSVRTEVIKIAGQDPKEIEVATTVHGPVFVWDEEAGIAYSKRWSAWGAEGQVWGGQLDVARAKTKADFEQLMKKAYILSVNITVGDNEGNIRTWSAGNTPNRSKDIDPRLPTPGTGEYDWGAFAPQESWPSLENPERGFIVVWNNKSTSDEISGDNGRWGKHFRTYLPLSLLSSDNSISREDMLEFNKIIGAAWLSVDLNLTSTQFFERFWDEALEGANDPRLEEAVKLMNSWDGLFLDRDEDGAYDAPGLLIYRTWLEVARDAIFVDDLGDWRTETDLHNYIKYGTSLLIRVLEGDQAGLPPKWDFLNGLPRKDVVRQTLVKTIERLEKEYGTDMTKWNRPIFKRFISRAAFNASDDETAKIPLSEWGRYSQYSGGGLELGAVRESVRHNGAPGWMALMEIGGENTRIDSVIPAGGQSWMINSRYQISSHLYDQALRHRDFKLKPVYMTLDDIQRVQESELVLKPAQ